MMRILKQRWVIAVLAVGATLLFITYVYPKIKKATAGKVPGTNTAGPQSSHWRPGAAKPEIPTGRPGVGIVELNPY